MKRRPLTAPHAAQRGFTYIGLLIAVALMGMALAAAGTVASAQRQRAKEQELLFVGAQFRRAIGLYYERSPGGVKQFPPSIEALLQDPRYPAVQRYLRKRYADPISGKAEWGLVQGPGGTVMGVYSLSQDAPLKTGNFAEVNQSFEGKTAYSDWKFVYIPPQQNTAFPGGVLVTKRGG